MSRSESPAPRRRSSGVPPTSRQGSFVGQYAKQWDSPRGSVSHVTPRSRSPSGHVTPRGSMSRIGHVPKLSTTSPLARDNSETNIGTHASKIRAQKMSKEDLLMPVRSDSSCSLGKLSVDLSELSERQRPGDDRAHVTRDSQGDVTRDALCDTSSEVSDEGYKSSQGNVSAKTEETNTLRLGRENTNMSTSEERPESSMTVGSDCSSTISSEDDDGGQTRDSDTSSSPIEDQDGSSSQTVIAASPAKRSQNSKTEVTPETPGDAGKKSQDLSPTTKSRLANLFNRMPKLGKSRSKDADDEVSEDKTDKVITNNSAKNSQHSANNSPIRTLPPSGGYGTLGRRSAGNSNPVRSQMTRTRSASSENGFIRSRPGLSSDLFQPPGKQTRTASASPALHRKRLPTSGPGPSPPRPSEVTSTHSTPSRRSNPRRQNSEDVLDVADFDTDEQILKRMEEILFTYKTKVEDKLAAEGKALPKDIFDDFTEHWVASSPHRAKSVDSLDSSERSDQSSVTRTPRTPNTRKEHRDGHRGTRIPAPTYYSGDHNAKTQ